jgi:hypothetical protein
MQDNKQNFIKTFKPHEKAPEFIKSDVIIDIDEIAKLAKSGENITEYTAKDGTKKRQIKLQLLLSKENQYYFQLNNYKPKTDNPF